MREHTNKNPASRARKIRQTKAKMVARTKSKKKLTIANTIQPLSVWRKRLVMCLLLVYSVGILPSPIGGAFAASTWNPTLLVNTEAFQKIDDSNTSSDLRLTFGESINKSLIYERTAQRFKFDDDLLIQGDLEVTGTMSGKSLYVSGTGASPLLVTKPETGRVGIGIASPERTLDIVRAQSGGSSLPQGILSFGNLLLSQTEGGSYFGRVGVREQPFGLNDVGVSWAARESNRAWLDVAISSDGKIQTAVDGGGQIYTSADYGVTWTARDSNRVWYSVAMSSDGKIQTAVVAGGQIYTSTNYGVTWVARDDNRNWYRVVMSSDGKIQTAVVNTGQIYTSTDFGVSWTARDSNRAWLSVTMSSDGKIQTATVSGGQIYTSSDYGVTWIARETSRNWFGVAMSNDGRIQTAVVSGGQIYTSTDFGVTWTARDSGRVWYNVSMSGDGKIQTAVVNAGQIYTSTDYGATWTARDSTRDWLSVAMSSDGKIQIATVYLGKLYVSHATVALPGGELEVAGTMSGRSVHAQDLLRSSGTLVVRGASTLQSTLNVTGNTTIDTNTLAVDASGNKVGILTTAPETELEVVGSMSGIALTVSSLKNCNTIDTNANGVLACGTDEGAGGALSTSTGSLQNYFDNRFVNTSGDTMTGALKVRANLSGTTLNVDQNANIFGALTTSGAIATKSNLTINSDNGAVDTVLTFGSDTIVETLSFLNTLDRFQFSDDVYVQGNMDVSGAMSGASLYTKFAMRSSGSIVQTPSGSGSTFFRQLGSLAIGTEPQQVVVLGRYAYIADTGSDDLKIVDVTNPGVPVTVGTLSLSTNPTGIAVAGSFAYITDAGSTDLKVIDVSNPASPKTRGSVTVGSSPFAVTVAGRYAYVLDIGSSDLKIIDVANPYAPVTVGTLTLGSTPLAIAVAGKYAYVVDQGSTDFKVIDVSNPKNPLVVGILDIAAGPIAVAVVGRYAYVLETAGDQLLVIDISNPFAPVSAGTLGVGGAPVSLALGGRYAYIVDATSEDLKVIDVSTPTAPVKVGSRQLGVQPFSIAVAGRFAYIIDPDANDLKIIDLIGIEASTANIGSIEAGSISVRDDINVYNDVSVGGTMNVGQGINISGPSAITNTATGASAYALTVTSRTGALKLSAQGTVNSPHLVFGTGTTFDTKLWRSAANILKTNGSVWATGTLSGATVTISSLQNCNTIDSSATGVLSCGTDDGGAGTPFTSTGSLQNYFDNRFVNTSGDTMTGALKVRANLSGTTLNVDQNANIFGALTTSGAIATKSNLTINSDNGAVDTVLTFGSDTIVETLSFLNTLDRFQFSDDVYIQGDLNVSATMSGKVLKLASGAIISRAANEEFIRLKDTTNNDSVGLHTGTGNPNATVTAQLGSIYIASDTGKIWKNNNGSTQWVEMISGSGSMHMAKMTRNAAQAITSGQWTKIAFDAEDFDIGSIGDFSSNDRFDVKKAGRYLIASTYGFPVSDTGYAAIAVYKNGSNIAQDGALSGANGATAVGSISEVLSLVPGDFVEMYINTSATTNTLTSTEHVPRMSVIQLQDNAGANFWTLSGSNLTANNTSGNVGIGNTDPRDAKLEVTGSMSGVSLTVSALKNCNTIDTNGNGVLACGTDEGAGGALSTSTGSLQNYFDNRFVNTSGDTMTGALKVRANLSGTTLNVDQNASIFGALTTSGAIATKANLTINSDNGGVDAVLTFGSDTVVETLSFLNTLDRFQFSDDVYVLGGLNVSETMSGKVLKLSSGAVISRAEDSEFIRLTDTTNSDSVGVRTGAGDPNSVVAAQLGSIYIAHDTGKIWKNNNGGSQWVEMTSGSGSMHMAKLTRDAAQSINHDQVTKIEFDAEAFDVGVIADFSTNDRIDIKKAGRYLIEASWYVEHTTQDISGYVAMYKNGSEIIRANANGYRNTTLNPFATDIVELQVGDYLEMYVLQSNSSTTAKNTDTNAHLKPRMSVIQLQDNAGANFWTLSGSNLTSNNSGNVGIGNSDPRDAKLEVTGLMSGSSLNVTNNAGIYGALTTSGAIATKSDLTINQDADSNNAILTFGSDATNETLSWMNTLDRFQFSDDVYVQGNLSVSGTMSGAALNTYDLNASKSATTGSVLISRTTGAPEWKNPVSSLVWYLDGVQTLGTSQGAIVVLPSGFRPTSVTLRVKNAPTGQALIVDINEGGTTIFGTRPQINAASTSGGGSAVFSDTSLAPGAELTLDIDQIGSGAAGSGLTVILNGIRNY